MTEIAKPAGAGKWEKLRRRRYGDVLKLIRYRYGVNGVVPDDEAGRPDLMQLLYLASMAPNAWQEKVHHCLELYAPWMQAEEVERLLQHLERTPHYEKLHTAEQLGIALHLSNADREKLKLWTIRPIDVNEAQLAEQAKARSRRQREAQRRKRGVRPRAEYLAEVKSKPKPWEEAGLSRWQWYRRNKVVTDYRRGRVETILTKQRTDLVAEQGERPKGSKEGELG